MLDSIKKERQMRSKSRNNDKNPTLNPEDSQGISHLKVTYDDALQIVSSHNKTGDSSQLINDIQHKKSHKRRGNDTQDEINMSYMNPLSPQLESEYMDKTGDHESIGKHYISIDLHPS